MSKTVCILLVSFGFMCVLKGKAQEDSSAFAVFQQHYDRAEQYSELYLYGESMAELDEAIRVAHENGLEQQRINAVITMSELMRKTEDFAQGLSLLKNLPESEQFPDLHVRKLGRMAALYFEGPTNDRSKQIDTVEFYLRQALDYANDGGFRMQEAVVKNELGYLITGQGKIEEGLELLLESASIFQELGETKHYVVPMTHVVDNYQRMGDCERADSVSQSLFGLLEGNEWYDLEIDLYNLLSFQAFAEGDSLTYFIWREKALKSIVKRTEAISSNQMAAFRVLQETRKYQEQARESSELAQLRSRELARETAHSRELFVYLFILAALVLGVVALLFRERNLKRKVDIANERYHMLIVESNHRIKNNLQMVISMLEYASKDLPNRETSALKRMSGKIQTISALHKHLYLDAHNERVDLNMYFSEIIALYEEISPEDFHVERHMEHVLIKSERIVYFGLIFNEMLANTIEHHKANVKTVHISVRAKGERFQFQYVDDSAHSEKLADGTGRGLIKQLIKRVGGSHFEFDPSRGLYQFQFQP